MYPLSLYGGDMDTVTLTGQAFSPVNTSWPAIGQVTISYELDGAQATNFVAKLNGSEWLEMPRAQAYYSGTETVLVDGAQMFTYNNGEAVYVSPSMRVDFSLAPSASVLEPPMLVLAFVAAVCAFVWQRYGRKV